MSRKIITVGDPDRALLIADRLDAIHLRKQKREFLTITGRLGSQEISIISTGIGTDNIDICFNEIDSLFNIDYDSRSINENIERLAFYRIGTSGALQPELEVDSFLASEYAIGLEGLMSFYQYSPSEKQEELNQAVEEILQASIPFPIHAFACDYPIDSLPAQFHRGITLTATGFYGPQGRKLRGQPQDPGYLDKLKNLKWGSRSITNFEMETAGIYGLCHVLGHQCISFNALLANRATRTFSNQPQKTIDRLIDAVLPIIESDEI